MTKNKKDTVFRFAIVVRDLPKAIEFYKAAFEAEKTQEKPCLAPQSCSGGLVLKSEHLLLELLPLEQMPDAKPGLYQPAVELGSLADSASRAGKSGVDSKKKEELLNKLRKLGSL